MATRPACPCVRGTLLLLPEHPCVVKPALAKDNGEKAALRIEALDHEVGTMALVISIPVYAVLHCDRHSADYPTQRPPNLQTSWQTSCRDGAFTAQPAQQPRHRRRWSTRVLPNV